ncbi:MAG: histidine phosphatase family protein [Pyrinomonadaceae bacterium]
MKTRFIGLLFASMLMVLYPSADVFGQDKKTIVLVRHVEKDSSPEADIADPDLSPEGRERAQRLVQAIKKYKPHEIFSTSYKRTMGTAEPIAKKRKKQIQTYDPAKHADLIEKMMASKTEHYLVVGHSNTIPSLANLLFKKEIFRQMPDTEYGVFWVIRVRNGVVTKVEVRPY